ncbi:methylglutaconyl-CoA hydratase [Fonticula alba]|uniref:Methylglutaconyl-CoA hydratase n=1 Tax=Fonticula alba TaxID=691883 RepID=A0A058Z4G9_FONAL|nr:methylglutaconyl-CoA hydratase [Fonticula alba]KCV68823.1 methylglutaconyl-CoA hydratase [Fonticula alba]|eukprot:XP_009496394.1 methylglutaconyl-CoA hydratase [Fonticula alba]
MLARTSQFARSIHLSVLRAPATTAALGRRFESSLAAPKAADGSDEEVFVTHLQGADQGVAVLSMNRPAAKNALSKKLLADIRATVDRLRSDSSVRVLILRSHVPGAFCAGADLKERATMPAHEVSDFVHGIRSLFNDIENLPFPTIASLDGAAFGGGLEMALACDFRTAGAGARLALSETKLAIIPGAGGTQRLPRLVGMHMAKKMIFTASPVNASTAESIGLVTEAGEQAYPLALNLARQILPQGPIAIQAAKVAISKGAGTDLATGLAIEQACYHRVIPTKDRLEGLQAFREKRAPVYKGE